jgi:hypothetical protein
MINTCDFIVQTHKIMLWTYSVLHKSMNSHIVTNVTPILCMWTLLAFTTMALEMSVDLKWRIVAWYLEDGSTYWEISGLAYCSIGHVSCMSNVCNYGQVKFQQSVQVVAPVTHLPSKMVISNTSPASLQPTQHCIWMSCRLNLQPFEISIF